MSKGFTNDGKYDKICNMKKYVLFSKARRAGCAAVRRIVVFCVLSAYLFSLSAFALEIPRFVTRIEEGAFIGNTAIKEVTIPASVTFIGEEAFADCTNLTTIKIFATDVEFGDNALGRLGEKRTIIAHKGSSVEEYAKLYGFTFEEIVTKVSKLLAYADWHATKVNKDGSIGSFYDDYDCVEFVNDCFSKALGMKTGAVTTNGIEGWRVGKSNYGELEKYNKDAIKITKITDLRPGDIICWKEDKKDYCTHVGIYVGKGVINGKEYSTGVFVDSSRSKGHVGYRLIPVSGTNFYTRNFMFGWRIIEE